MTAVPVSEDKLRKCKEAYCWKGGAPQWPLSQTKQFEWHNEGDLKLVGMEPCESKEGGAPPWPLSQPRTARTSKNGRKEERSPMSMSIGVSPMLGLQPYNCKILGRKYGKGSPREELQPYNCKIFGRKYGKRSPREELQPYNCKIVGRKYGKGSPREELQPYNCKILGRKYGKRSPREELQPYNRSGWKNGSLGGRVAKKPDLDGK